ncbi:MAG: GNAT family N-acetyltransferase [Deltaproteobacteria bacterium]|nr:GNAT family N-acetyltransferase [Deltaproteobacteria bacterium]
MPSPTPSRIMPPTPAFHLRPLAPHHYGDVATLMAGSDPWVTLGVTEEHALRSLMEHPIPGIVAEEEPGGRLLGFVRYEPRGFIGYSAYIRTVAVAPEARGQKVGEAMVRHVEELVFRHVPLLFLFCSSFNPRGQAFYTRLGYARVGEVAGMIVPQHGEVLFVKRRPEAG